MAVYLNATAGQQRPGGAVVNVVRSNSAAPAGDVSITVTNPGNFKTKAQFIQILLELATDAAQNAGLK